MTRPRLSDEETVRVTATVPKSYLVWLQKQDRNTSAAVRALIEAAMARQDKQDKHETQEGTR